jgi:hypothetical protein
VDTLHEEPSVKLIITIAAAGLIATGLGGGGAGAQTAPALAERAQRAEARQTRGEPAMVAKKRGTRCRIVKRPGPDKHVCSRTPIRR